MRQSVSAIAMACALGLFAVPALAQDAGGGMGSGPSGAVQDNGAQPGAGGGSGSVGSGPTSTAPSSGTAGTGNPQGMGAANGSMGGASSGSATPSGNPTGSSPGSAPERLDQNPGGAMTGSSGTGAH